MIKVSSLSVSQRGKVRSHNEDALYSDDQVGIWLVADGMGGHSSGEVASAIATEEIYNSLKNGLKLDHAIIAAHQIIRTQGQQSLEQEGMGTTIVAVKLEDNEFHVAWVGDSRIYNYHLGRNLTQLSTDHSVVQDMIARKELTESEATTHKQRNLITQSLGMHRDELRVGQRTLRPTANGQLFLCTDGITDYLSTTSLHKLFDEAKSAEELVISVTDSVLNTEAGDNFSFILINYNVD